MSKTSPIYRLLAVGSQQQHAVKRALKQGKNTRLFMIQAQQTTMPQNITMESTSDNALLLDYRENSHGDTLDFLRRLPLRSALVIHASVIDTGHADFENKRISPNKKSDCDLTNEDKASQCAILPRASYDQLIKEHQTFQGERQNLQILTEMLRDGILVVSNNEGIIRYANPATSALFQRPAEQIIGCPFGYPITSDNDAEITVLRPDGKECVIEMRATPTIWNNEPVLLASLHDVTEQKQLQHELEDLATHDGLTGIYNRRAFYSQLETEIRRSQRYDRPLSLLMLDIDHFKQVNDTYGHQTGDSVLCKLSRLLTRQARNIDRVCRYGGEEIVIILPETETDTALEVSERLRKTIEAHYFESSNGQKFRVTVSIGVAGYPAHAKEVNELIRAADTALYDSKKKGRNRVSLMIQ